MHILRYFIKIEISMGCIEFNLLTFVSCCIYFDIIFVLTFILNFYSTCREH